MGDLTLPLKGEYFDAIKAGTKLEEYRLCTAFWEKRIEEKRIDRIVLTRGYPPRGDESRRMILPWRGYEIKEITHPHFGPDPVRVYAIAVSSKEE
jgi:ASC-1-like (ASCH) protein